MSVSPSFFPLILLFSFSVLHPMCRPWFLCSPAAFFPLHPSSSLCSFIFCITQGGLPAPAVNACQLRHLPSVRTAFCAICKISMIINMFGSALLVEPPSPCPVIISDWASLAGVISRGESGVGVGHTDMTDLSRPFKSKMFPSKCAIPVCEAKNDSNLELVG